MGLLRLVSVSVAAVMALGVCHGARAASEKPLVIGSQGSFFVGGEVKAVTPPPGANALQRAGDITVNQMYVQYQTPAGRSRHLPVVMVHGCCLSSKTWETTPDGRMGWNEYFLRKDRPVYLADQVSRARSGFDPTAMAAVKAGTAPPSVLPNIIAATHQLSWVLFRFGSSYPNAYADEQFPVQAADELYKQMIPDLNSQLPTPNPTWTSMAALARQLHGAVLMGHSESGFFPEQAALIDPTDIRGLITIEAQCPADLTAAQVAQLAKIPTLVMFGDHLGDAPTVIVNWQRTFEACNAFVEKLEAAGGDAQMMHLPKMGLRGNSHMLMQDKNNLQVADLILGWIDAHAERKSH